MAPRYRRASRAPQLLVPVTLLVSFACAAGHAEHILRGEPTGPGTFTFMASVRSAQGRHICGATLVADSWVLTTAKCLSSPAQVAELWMAGDNLSNPDSFQRRQVETVQTHPFFSDDGANDVGLVKLDSPVESPSPVTISDSAALEADDLQVTVVGWGATSEDSARDFSALLRRAAVRMVPFSRCNELYSNELARGMICAGPSADGEPDACTGDQGGPLLARESENGPFLQTGILAFGERCGDPEKPMVYMAARSYLCWMHNVTDGAVRSPTGPCPATRELDESPVCVPGTAQIRLESGTDKSVSELVVGDRVLTGPGPLGVSEIHTWSHRDAVRPGQFLRISLQANRTLTVSPGHLVFTPFGLRPASRLAPLQDFLISHEGEPVAIVAVSRVFLPGIYNPHTLSGSIVVDGFQISCYTEHVDARCAHVLLWPMRLLYRICGFDALGGVAVNRARAWFMRREKLGTLSNALKSFL